MRQREIPMSFFAGAVEGKICFSCMAKPTKIKRMTRGEDYEVFGGSKQCHALMVKFVEAVSRRTKSSFLKSGIEKIENDEFSEIVRLSAAESFGNIRVTERKQ